jgi:hypothetical protein
MTESPRSDFVPLPGLGASDEDRRRVNQDVPNRGLSSFNVGQLINPSDLLTTRPSRSLFRQFSARAGPMTALCLQSECHAEMS